MGILPNRRCVIVPKGVLVVPSFLLFFGHAGLQLFFSSAHDPKRATLPKSRDQDRFPFFVSRHQAGNEGDTLECVVCVTQHEILHPSMSHFAYQVVDKINSVLTHIL